MSRRNRDTDHYEYDNESPRPCSCERCKSCEHKKCKCEKCEKSRNKCNKERKCDNKPRKCDHCDVDKNVEVKNDGKCFIITIKHCP